MTTEILYVFAGLAAIIFGCIIYLKYQLKIAEAREAEEAKAQEASNTGSNKVYVFREIILKRRHPITGTNLIYVPVRRKA